ncbi:WD40 repeat domain-containing protein [Cyanobacteria bacterium FACHB-471]|nr:WD40 repeat domain-containing protein [Cyanobacteria bacterium FACHB-471]
MVGQQIPSNPFPGLRPFTFAEANLFYGREGQTNELLRILTQTRFLAVVGVSGSGKSSLIRAGLLPALEDNTIESNTHWRVAIARPENDPVGNLATELNKIQELRVNSDNSLDRTNETELTSADLSFDIIEALLRRGSRGLIETVWRARLPDNMKLLIVIDQFEELFRFKQTFSQQSTEHVRQDAVNEAAAFVKLLIEATKKQDEFPIYVVLTMRSDFLGECSQFRDLPEAINEGQYLIPRMTRSQIRDAIERPVEVSGATITPRLVNRLLNTVGDNSDQLPILQHALMRTWNIWATEHQLNEPIDLQHYQATGGMDHALSNHADAIFNELTQEQQTIAEVLFKRLTKRTPDGQDIRDPTRLDEICAIANATEANVINVVNAFRAEGRSFLMPSIYDAETLTVNSVLDISHESLIRLWQQLKQWVAEEAESVEAYHRLIQATLLYQNMRGELWTGIDLASALTWQKEQQPDTVWARRYNPQVSPGSIFQEALDFLNKSQQKRLRELNRERRIGITLIILSLMVGIGAFIASIQYAKAQKAQIESENSQLLGRVSNAGASFALNDQLSALITALQAAEQVQKAQNISSENRLSTVVMLRQIIYSIQERDRLVHSTQAEANRDSTRKVYSASFSQDGRWIASGGGDFTVKLWSLDSNSSQTLQGHRGAVFDVAFSPTQSLLASAGADNVIKLWRLDGSSIRTIGTQDTGDQFTLDIEDISFSPDGSVIVAAYKDNLMRLWDLNGRLIRTFEGHSNLVRAVNFNATGDRLTSADADGVIKLWDFNGNELNSWDHGESVQDIVYSPDGQFIASVGNDNQVKVWRVDGELVRTLAGHGDRIYSVRFSPDGRAIASASADRTIKLWDANTGDLLDTLQGHRQSILSVDFSADGQTLVSSGFDNTIRLWARAHTTLERLPSRSEEIRSISTSPNNRFIAYAHEDGVITLWNKATRTSQLLEEHSDTALSTAFSPDSQYLLTSSLDGTVKLWRIGELNSLQTLNMINSDSGQDDNVATKVVFSPNGQLIAAAGTNSTVTLWNIDGTLQHTFQAHDEAVLGVAFNPDSQQVASASADNTAKIWTLEGRLLHTLSGHEDWVYSVSFSPDGRELVSASADRTIRRWRLSDGQLITPPLRGHEDAVSDVTFDPDGNTIASVSYDNTVRLWSRREGTLIRTLEGHSSFVYSLSFSPDGKTLASASADKSVILWNLDLDNLIQRGCQWAFAYIQRNPSLSEGNLPICSNDRF